jgi:hypothetical protein
MENRKSDCPAGEIPVWGYNSKFMNIIIFVLIKQPLLKPVIGL